MVWPLIGTIATAVVAATAGIYSTRKTFRSSARTTDTGREIAQDQRADAELARVMADRDRYAERLERVEAENERLRLELARLMEERSSYAERYARLRIAVIEHELDPDDIVGRPGDVPAPRPPSESRS